MSTTDEIVATGASNLLNVNMSNVTKLTATNFLVWYRQVHALLNGYDLAGYLDGKTPPPPPTLTVDGVVSANPASKHWIRQDQLIYSGLIGAISGSVQPLLSKANTSAQIWSTLFETYANPSRIHIKVLREQLKLWKKETKSIDEYFQGFTTRFDHLALLESEIKHEDQIDYILAGLPDDYRQVIDQIENREPIPSLTVIHEKLINYELKLQTSAAASLSTPVTVNAATYKNSSNNNNSRNQNCSGYRGNQSWSQTGNKNDSRGSGRGYQGKCQLCGVYGHSTRRCSQLQTSNGGYQPTHGGYPSPHMSYPQTSMQPWQPRANVAMAPPPYNPRILDSGATHHLTSDLANLSMHQPYNGGEEVTIADGTGLPISHTGSALLPTPSRSPALQDILYVPNVSKNLISVYRICNANKVSVEFFPAHFSGEGSQHGGQITPRAN